MTYPNSVKEQLADTYFIPKHKLVVYFSCAVFDSGVKMKEFTGKDIKTETLEEKRNRIELDTNGNPKQAMQDLTDVDKVTKQIIDLCDADCSTMKKALERYKVTDLGPELIEENGKKKTYLYRLNQPSEQEKNKVMKQIKYRLREHPHENYLIIFVLAGHGMHQLGKQIVLLNDWKSSAGFYKNWGVEEDIRDMAALFPNSYLLAFFACCRENFDVNVHSGNISREEAYKLLDKSEPERLKIESNEVQDEDVFWAVKEDEGDKQEGETKARGGAGGKISLNIKRENYAFFFGCRTGMNVKGDTKMILDLQEKLLNGFQRNGDFSIVFPQVLDSLQGTDVNFEQIKSNSIQQLKLFYDDNVITKKKCLILVHTGIRTPTVTFECKHSVKKGIMMKKLFEDEFQFDDVQLITDMPKTETVEIFNEIQTFADKFDTEEKMRKKEAKDKKDLSYVAGKLLIACVNIGFILEKKSSFYTDQLVKNEHGTKYAPPKILKADKSAFYDKTFNITREGKLLAISDYACKWATGKNTHVIQIDDYSQDQQLRINTKPEIKKCIMVPVETFPEMSLTDRESRHRYTYLPKCNTRQLYKYFKDARKKEKRKRFQIPHHFKEAKSHVEKFRVADDDNNKEGESKDISLSDITQVSDKTWKDLKEKNAMSEEYINMAWFLQLEEYTDKPIIVALRNAQLQQNAFAHAALVKKQQKVPANQEDKTALNQGQTTKKPQTVKNQLTAETKEKINNMSEEELEEIEKDGPLFDQKYIKLKIETQEAEIEQIIIDCRYQDEKDLTLGCKKTSTFFTGKWNEKPELIMDLDIPNLNVKPSVHTLEKGNQILLISGTSKNTEAKFTFYDNKPPFAPIHEFCVEKYADFYEAGSMLLEDNRPAEILTRDYDICFLFHSETPCNSTVPFTILKMHYEEEYYNDETIIETNSKKVAWKEMKTLIHYNEVVYDKTNLKDHKSKIVVREGDTWDGVEYRGLRPVAEDAYIGSRNKSKDNDDKKRKPGEEELLTGGENLLLKLAREQRKQKNNGPLQQPLFSYCQYSEDTPIRVVQKCREVGKEEENEIVDSTWGKHRVEMMKNDYVIHEDLSPGDVDLIKDLIKAQHDQLARTFGRYDHTQPLYSTIKERQIRVSKAESEKFLTAQWKASSDDRRDQIIVFTSKAVKIFLTKDLSSIRSIYYHNTVKTVREITCASLCKPPENQANAKKHQYVFMVKDIETDDTEKVYDDEKLFPQDSEIAHNLKFDGVTGGFSCNTKQLTDDQKFIHKEGKIMMNGKTFDSSYLGSGLESSEFGLVVLYKGHFNLDCLDEEDSTELNKENGCNNKCDMKNRYHKEKAFVIKNERVYCAAECDSDTVVVMLKESDVLVISNWRYARRIDDPQTGNEEKRFLTQFPGPDFKNLPFLISSGKESLNFIGGDRRKMQQLIIGENLPLVGQQGVSFTKIKCTNPKHLDEKTGKLFGFHIAEDYYDSEGIDTEERDCQLYKCQQLTRKDKNDKIINYCKNKDCRERQCNTAFTMDLCTTVTDENNKITLSWYRMPFHGDFATYLKEYNRLPYDSVEEAMMAHTYKDKEMARIVNNLVETKIKLKCMEREKEDTTKLHCSIF